MFFLSSRPRLPFFHFQHKISCVYLACSLELQPTAIHARFGECGIHLQFVANGFRVDVDELFCCGFDQHHVGFSTEIVFNFVWRDSLPFFYNFNMKMAGCA